MVENWLFYCQGFTKLHSGLGPNRLRPQELKNILIAISSRTTLDLS
jgi:hypothetical protein